MKAKITLAWLFFAFYACQNLSSPYLTIDGKAQGTTFHIVYSDSLQRDFLFQIDSLLKLIDSSMSLWDSSSVISRINRNEPDVIPDEHFLNVLNKSFEVSNATQGAFDVTISPLVKAWGFGTKHNLPLPDSGTVDSIKSFTGFQNISITGQQILKTDPRVQLDFNAIAQGYSVDVIASFLETHQIHNYLVEIGGELRVKGKNERNTLWTVGIDQPTDDPTAGRPLQTTITLQDKALATSGSYRKYQMKDGKKLSHVINPASGYPVGQQLLSVSVLADDCMTADAYATAFLVMGTEAAMQLAQKLALEIYCIYTDDEGKFQVKASSAFSQ
jgi:thiamine biosynthesis lipoprotein